MFSEASILLLAVFIAIVVTLFVEYLRSSIARRFLIIGGAGIMTVILIFYLLSGYLSEELVEPDTATQISKMVVEQKTVAQSLVAMMDTDDKEVAAAMQPQQVLTSASKSKQGLHVKSTQKLPGEFPEASLRYLTGDELKNRTSQELKIMRNEIFARHSYIFKNKNMNEYFSRFSWYRAEYVDITARLTEIENANILLIREFENLNR